MKILRIDSSAKENGSVSRRLTNRLLTGLDNEKGKTEVLLRDLSKPLPQIDAAWVDASTTPEKERSDSQQRILDLSDTLVEELEDAELVVIGLPVYNFSVPASLKLWIDLICRARRTFTYEDGQPKGLISGTRAVVIYVSGGTHLGAENDFAGGFIQHILRFIGITQIDLVDASAQFTDGKAIRRAEAQIDRLINEVSTPDVYVGSALC